MNDQFTRQLMCFVVRVHTTTEIDIIGKVARCMKCFFFLRSVSESEGIYYSQKTMRKCFLIKNKLRMSIKVTVF